MNILLIGNGFDLAHGLPTKYTDFLDFVRVIKQIIEEYKNSAFLKPSTNSDNFLRLNSTIRSLIDYQIEQTRTCGQYKEFINLWDNIISNNIWIEYFLINNNNIKNNWIDFEKEISFVISRLDWYINEASISSIYDLFDYHVYYDDSNRNLRILLETYRTKISKNEFNIYSFISEIEKDLEKLIFALELYISNYINDIKVIKTLPNIKRLSIDKIISFNYSNTFERVYDKNYSHSLDFSKYDYIHGKAISHFEYEENDLVLGINEYLPDDEKDKNIRFIRFKKFFQRIHKNTGCIYTEWLEEINTTPRLEHNLYIFGHSLDDTDRDILRELILNEHIVTTIYYHNKEAYAQQIANLVKVIGQEELISKTGGVSKNIIFKKLLPM